MRASRVLFMLMGPKGYRLALLVLFLALAFPGIDSAAADEGHNFEAADEPPMPAGEEFPDEAPTSGDLGLLDLDGLGLFDDLALLAAEDYVVSATRHAQRIEESPAAITVITREQILESGYRDLVDILRLVPGADVYRIREGHVAVGLRSRSNYGSDRVLALIDGRDIAPSLFGTPVWMGMPVDIGSIERVEVIRGPASTLYGANALQGVINIVTRSPTEELLQVEGDVSGSDPLRHGADVRAHGTIDAWSWWASAGYDYRTQSFDAESETPDFWTYRARLMARYQPSKEVDLSAELGASRLHTQVHLIEMGRGQTNIDWPYLRASLRLGRTEIQLIAEYIEFLAHFDFNLNLPGLGDSGLISLAEAPDLYQPHYSAQAVGQHHLDLFEGNRLTVGISLQAVHYLPATSTTCPDSTFHDFDPDDCELLEETEGRAGIFLLDEWRLTDNLTFTGGLRIDQNSLTPEVALSPRAAMVWRPAHDHALRLSYGRAYRKPTYLQSRTRWLMEVNEEAPSDITARLVHLFSRGPGNPDLKNEKTDSYELGWRGRLFDGALVATTDLFYIRFIDGIWFDVHRTSLEPGFGGSLTISDEAYIRYENRDPTLPIWSCGGEATLALHPTQTLELRAVYGLDYFVESLLDEETGEPVGQRVAYEPIHRLAGVLRWSPASGLSTGLDIIYVSSYAVEMPDPSSALLPRSVVPIGGHVLINASVSYRLKLRQAALEIGASVLNLPDLSVFDQPSIDTDEGPFGADRLSRRATFFVRGQY